MEKFSGLPTEKNGHGPFKKDPSKKKQPGAFSSQSNLEKLESSLKRQFGIAPVAESGQLIWLAHALIGDIEKQPEMYRDSPREARELRTVLLHLSKALEKLTMLLSNSNQSDEPSGNGKLSNIA